MAAAVCCFLYRIIKINSGIMPVLELGFFYTLLVVFYFTFPLIVYLGNGNEFLLISDSRLRTAAPSPDEMSQIAWYYVLYMMGFTVFYTLVRGKEGYSLKAIPAQKIENMRFVVTVACYVVVSAIILAVNQAYHLGDAENYAETYFVFWELPTFVRQVYYHAGSCKITIQIVLIVMMMRNLKKYRYIIYGLVLFEFMTTITTLHARSSLVFTMFSVLLAYNYFVKRLKVKYILGFFATLLSVFIILGQLRSGGEVLSSSLLGFFSHNEFEAVFGTLFHYNQQVQIGDAMEVSVLRAWLNDVQNIIPQQLLPFQKIDISHTYSVTYIAGLADQGGGYPGGTLLEAIIGLGLIDSLLKGAVIGSIFGYIFRKCMLEKRSFWKALIYIWVTVLSYKTFARGTFYLVPQFLYDFVVPIVIIAGISAILNGAVKAGRKKTTGLFVP